MKALLITYNITTGDLDESRLVDIDDDHNFANGPYQDSVPFSVGSNQTIVEIEEDTGLLDD
jgi:hypothetical protein